MHWRYSHHLCCPGFWKAWCEPSGSCCVSLRRRILSNRYGEFNTQAANCALTPFFKTCYHTHFTSQGRFLSRAERPGSPSVDYKHTQVACMACLSSDTHSGAGCLRGVCNTRMASQSLGLSVSDRHFNLRWGQLNKGQCVCWKKLQLHGK